ncbi:MAG: polysaccharide deacetylase family protein [Fimbriimonas ginsengisoli]|uniref:Polysaccharide deacetylase family protein n=1 Tax=Fimbriimonas ginsengisoli TaxID=1005039 RepID=A0A931LTJ7_FIMGI|nr:polysaccharide deacetylase family protein [Fimbriimonas ginsengisoli]
MRADLSFASLVLAASITVCIDVHLCGGYPGTPPLAFVPTDRDEGVLPPRGGEGRIAFLSPPELEPGAPNEIRRGLPPRTVVLTYHDVIERRDGRDLWFDCTAGELREQIRWLKRRGAHFITLDQLYAHLAKGASLPTHPVAVTFADNYLGFWERGYPVLRAEGVPVAMFVHTGYVGDRSHGRPKMDWDQLRSLDREGLVTIGSQTVSHPTDLRRLSTAELRKEMEESKRELERQLGHTVSYFAYPNGKFNAAAMRAAQAAGYLMAMTEVTRPAEASPSLFAVNRYVHTRYRQGWREAGGR